MIQQKNIAISLALSELYESKNKDLKISLYRGFEDIGNGKFMRNIDNLNYFPTMNNGGLLENENFSRIFEING